MIHINIWAYIAILVLGLIYAYFWRYKILKSTQKDDKLTMNELIGVIITLIINVIMFGAIYEIAFRKKYPIKTKQIKKFTLIIFFIIIFLQFGLNLPIFRVTR